MAVYQIGDLIRFSYPAVNQQQTQATDMWPTVLVLHDGWVSPPSLHPNVHGLNFNYLQDAEINLIRMVLDPQFQLKYYPKLEQTQPNVVRMFDHIMQTAEGTPITSPYDFYHKAIKPFVEPKGYEPYRRYRPDKIQHVRVIMRRPILTGETKPGIFQRVQQQFQTLRTAPSTYGRGSLPGAASPIKHIGTKKKLGF